MMRDMKNLTIVGSLDDVYASIDVFETSLLRASFCVCRFFCVVYIKKIVAGKTLRLLGETRKKQSNIRTMEYRPQTTIVRFCFSSSVPVCVCTSSTSWWILAEMALFQQNTTKTQWPSINTGKHPLLEVNTSVLSRLERFWACLGESLTQKGPFRPKSTNSWRDVQTHTGTEEEKQNLTIVAWGQYSMVVVLDCFFLVSPKSLSVFPATIFFMYTTQKHLHTQKLTHRGEVPNASIEA